MNLRKIKKLIKTLRKQPIDKNWLIQNRQALIHFIKTGERKMPAESLNKQERLSTLALFTNKLKTMPAVLIALLLLGGGAGVTAASQGSLPTDILYPVKIASERTAEVFVPGVNYKVAFDEKIANRRMQEVEQLLEKHPEKQEVIEKTVKRFENRLDKIEKRMAKPNISKRRLAEVDNSFNRYEKALDRTAERFSGDYQVKERLQKTQERVLEKEMRYRELQAVPKTPGQEQKTPPRPNIKERANDKIKRTEQRISLLEKRLENVEQIKALLEQAKTSFQASEYESALDQATQSLRLMIKTEAEGQTERAETAERLTKIQLVGTIQDVNLETNTIVLKIHRKSGYETAPSYKIQITPETKITGLKNGKAENQGIENIMSLLSEHIHKGAVVEATAQKRPAKEVPYALYENIIADYIRLGIVF